MVTLNWCKKQDRGLKLIHPNVNLSQEYLKNSLETLDLLKIVEGKSNMWLSTMIYYSEYFAIYSVLMKVGIKSEIHDCTIELIKYLEEFEVLPPKTFERISKHKHLRIENQYYLKNTKVNFNYDDLFEFIYSIKEILNTMTTDKTKEIREFIENI